MKSIWCDSSYFGRTKFWATFWPIWASKIPQILYHNVDTHALERCKCIATSKHDDDDDHGEDLISIAIGDCATLGPLHPRVVKSLKNISVCLLVSNLTLSSTNVIKRVKFKTIMHL